MIAILVLVFLVVLIFTSWIILLKDSKSFNVPGPTPLPVIGNGLIFAVKPPEVLPLLHKLKEKWGDAYRAHLFHNPYVILSHPKYVEPLLSHTDLITKGRSYSFLQSWLGEGLLTSTGHKWRTSRKFLTPAFHFNILHNFLTVFLKNEKVLIKKLQNHADGEAFDVFPIIALTALDNVMESIMGVSIDAQINSQSKYVQSIELLAGILSLRMRNPFLGEDAIFNLLKYKKIQDEALSVIHSQTKKVIETRREELKNANITELSATNDTGIKNKHAFLDLLLLSTVDGNRIDDVQVREQVDTFMFEGHDTTTSGISFALYCVSKHPDVQDKILEEQRSILGDNFDRDPTYAEVQQMKYLELVLKECLRLYPSVPLIERLITKDTEVGGLKLRKNTSVVINIFEIHRNPELYDNPMEFRPERHNTADGKSAKSAFNWLAFSAGPRNCIGQKFGMLELKVTVASIIKNFVVLPSDMNEPALCSELVLRSDDGVNIKLKPRNKNY